jgi:DNA-binding IclR family transcriptional regulator
MIRALRNGMPRYNDNTIVSPRKLRLELDNIRRVGYSIDDEEETIGLRCIGAPVLDARGKPMAAISIAGTTTQINEQNFESLAATVRKSAGEISARLELSRPVDNASEPDSRGLDRAQLQSLDRHFKAATGQNI